MAAVHQLILEAVRDGIAGLALDGVEEVVVRKVPFRAKLTLPSCMVTTFQKGETYRGGTLGKDDVGYPAYVVFITADPQDDATQARMLLWRQRVSRLFANQPLPAVAAADVMMCEVEPDPAIDWDANVAEFCFSALLLRFWTRVPRGAAAAAAT